MISLYTASMLDAIQHARLTGTMNTADLERLCAVAKSAGDLALTLSDHLDLQAKQQQQPAQGPTYTESVQGSYAQDVCQRPGNDQSSSERVASIQSAQQDLAAIRDYHAEYLERRRKRGLRTATDMLMKAHQYTYAQVLDFLEALKAMVAEAEEEYTGL